MKKLFVLIIIALCIVAPETMAQRYLASMRGLQVTAGSVNALNYDKGFHTGIAFSQYTKRTDRLVFGFEYLEKSHSYKDITVPQSQFTVDAGYYLKFISNARKWLFVSVGASGMAGYETVNWGEKLLFDGATLENKDKFLWGAALTLETEIYLIDRLVLLVNIRERLLSGSSIGNLNTQFGLGIKVIIN